MTRDLRPTGPAPLPRCLAVWAAATAALTGAVVLLGPAFTRLPREGTQPGAGFEPLLVGVCETVVLGCVAWLWVATGIVLLDAARGRVRERRGVPAPLRRLVLGLCGVTLAGAIAAPGHATPALPADPAPGGHSSAALVRGLPLPDRASAVGHVARLLLRRTHAAGSAPIVVRAGDTLWDLAAAGLPESADDAAVDAAWRRIYRANRAQIGPDPDLIHPGQRLELPR